MTKAQSSKVERMRSELNALRLEEVEIKERMRLCMKILARAEMDPETKASLVQAVLSPLRREDMQ